MNMWPIPWWLASIISNVCICRIEFLNRTVGVDSFFHMLPKTWWLILIAQWGLWNSWSGAPSMMMAWIWFSVMNSLMRLASTQWAVGEQLNIQTIVGCGLMFAALYLIKTGSP